MCMTFRTLILVYIAWLILHISGNDSWCSTLFFFIPISELSWFLNLLDLNMYKSLHDLFLCRGFHQVPHPFFKLNPRCRLFSIWGIIFLRQNISGGAMCRSLCHAVILSTIQVTFYRRWLVDLTPHPSRLSLEILTSRCTVQYIINFQHFL